MTMAAPDICSVACGVTDAWADMHDHHGVWDYLASVLIAEEADHLHVFQRTATWVIPAGNGPLDPEVERRIKADYAGLRARNRMMPVAFGSEYPFHQDLVADVAPEERTRRLEAAWRNGGFFPFAGSFADTMLDEAANAVVADFVRDKIRTIVRDPAVADYPSSTRVSPAWFTPGFPSGYVADVLQNLEVLCELGRGSDPRLAAAVDWVSSKQAPDGRWRNEYAYNGKTWVDFERQGQPVLEVMDSLDGFVTAVGTPRAEVWDERIWDTEVRVDGGLASVWTKYAFYRGEQFSHCGVDVFELVRRPDGWKIVHLADTRRTTNCWTPPR